MKRPILAAAVLLALAVPAMAQAELAQMTGDAYLYAGPDPGYPMVATLYAGTTVDVQGCTAGWQWCDVIVANARGWVPGAYLVYEYDDQPVLVSNYGATIGIPIVAFSLGWYWGNYYRRMPFYGQYNYWYGWRPPYRPSPQPFPGPWHGGPGPGWHGPGPGPGWHGNPGQPNPPGQPQPQQYSRPMPAQNGWQSARPGGYPQRPVNMPAPMNAPRYGGERQAPPYPAREDHPRDDHQDHR